ncbi:hypothetical protein INT45_005289 [Circinella minor]|uniref:Uncharacterized protein n=1 Tax=Circinella minor TaxID=1195481 RepID=A0A8H7VL96_9FUNG|nr:hypothetical protein INT45_005289 [Circinella minor]
MPTEKDILQHQLQELKVLEAELSTVHPKARLYERMVPSSNVFFLAKDKNAVKSATKQQQDTMTKKLKELNK